MFKTCEIMLLLLTSVLGLFFSLDVCASSEKETIYLTQILNQLDAIKPLIKAAELQTPKNSRVQFHYVNFKDNDGKVHNGLLEDINAIESGIQDQLNKISVEPREVSPLRGDYTNG